MSGSTSLCEALVRHARDIVTVVGEDGIVRYVNDASWAVLGADPAEAPGRAALSYVHPDDVAQAADRRRWLMQGPGRHGTTLLRVRAGNGWRHVETTGVNLLHDPDVRGILYITRD
ncbi:MAG: PAS domain-containing protein, partial [Mycobacteriales bacterium]